jgi:TonB family protein
MGNLLSSIANPIARGFGAETRGLRAEGGSIASSRETDSYNRSSLALEFTGVDAAVAPGAPQLILKRPDTRMFRGLDEYTSGRDRGPRVFSFLTHLLIAFAIVWFGMMHFGGVVQTAETTVAPIQFTLYAPPPPPVMPVAKVQGGGGGGGMHQRMLPSKGRPPEVAKIPIVHLEEAKINLPKLAVAPATRVLLPQNAAVPQFGAPQSPQVALASQGSGSDFGFGLGAMGGNGQGHGTGAGPGGGGGHGGGLMNVGGGVSAPRVIYSVEPQFTSEARQANYQGAVMIQLIVDSQGNPQDVRVVRHLGMGLDERAIEAVKQYRFSPAIYQGHAVSVQMIINVDFHLH